MNRSHEIVTGVGRYGFSSLSADEFLSTKVTMNPENERLLHIILSICCKVIWQALALICSLFTMHFSIEAIGTFDGTISVASLSRKSHFSPPMNMPQ